MDFAQGEPPESTPSRNAWQESFRAPAISLPKGGGAIRGLGEKFAANPVTGTGSFTVPIATSPGRSGFGPQLSLGYDSGAGNGAFGFGWTLSLPAITRKTDKGLPRYRDAEESDVFIFAGAEDLVPSLRGDELDEDTRIVGGVGYRVRRYRPRIESGFALIERWSHAQDPAEVFWRSISRDNVTTWYGKHAGSRIFDPANATRVYSWLICETHDDKGNVIVYEYQREDGANVDLARAHERNRGARDDDLRSANLYPKRICYGNRRPYLPQLTTTDPWPQPPATLDAVAPHGERWMFEVVFDYDQGHVTPGPPTAGGIDTVGASVTPSREWTVRADPFSVYRPGFEIRTYRLCRRVLMFHHFPDEPDVGESCLVRATEFHHSDDQAYSFLRSVSHAGYKRSGADYLRRALPPVEFDYTQPVIDASVHEIAPESLENLPQGMDGGNYQWVDLESEGITGILSEQAEGWFYKRNLSPVHTQATFAPIEQVASRPNDTIAGGASRFMDLANDGELDLVVLDGPTPGFYEHDGGSGWEPFRAFVARLNRSFRDPNLRLVDLDGDGRADVLVTEDDAFTWHPSLGEEGFGAAERVATQRDEERGPTLVFADATQSIYVADMSGDGLADLVRIRNGEVCYWPNLGYGRFGAKVTMDNAPWFDTPESFEQRRVQLADVDGSGATDIVYLHGAGVRVYFNASGNAWQDARPLPAFPGIDDTAGIAVVDLLGNGTACLVWSSPLPNDARRCMRYVDLMGGRKPHLLVRMRNNLGAQTEVQYAPSTKFYLQDKLAGRPWITRLPFPVHVVERATVTDKWRKTTFSSTYSYHHGYFDGVEREFRGFGRVEQTDVESFDTFAAANRDSPYITGDLTLYQPPVRTITWFHTGAALERERMLARFEQEYFPRALAARPGGVRIDNVFTERVPSEPPIEAGLSDEEWREAMRACKGAMLRQEIYELPVTLEGDPVRLFSATTHNCDVRRLQSRGRNRHAAFLVTESESISYHYELDLTAEQPLAPDPRVAHTLNLLFDDLGNVQQSVAVGYARWREFDDRALAGHADLIRAVQRERHVAYTESHYTDDVIDATPAPAPVQYHRRRAARAVQTFELTGFAPGHGRYFELGDFRGYALSETLPQQGMTPVARKAYHELPQDEAATMRLVEHERSLYFKDDLSASLPLGQLGRLGMRYEQYKLALTRALLSAVFADGQLDDTAPDGVAVRDKLRQPGICGYASGAEFYGGGAAPPGADQEYWMRSGIAGFEPDAGDHFYLPRRYVDPFGNPTELAFDRYDLLVLSSTDALGNTSGVYVDPDPAVGVRADYRVLSPAELVDVSGNRTEVRFDVLGLVTAAAVKGKGAEADDLTGIDDAVANPDLATIHGYFDVAALTPAQARDRVKPALLNATTRFLYHFGENAVGGQVSWCDRPPSACSIARERHTASMAVADRPGPLQISFECSDGAGNVLMKRAQAEPAQPGGPLRWIVSGKTVQNNKGKPVKQYEPYFSESATCRAEGDVHEEVGVTPLMYYDAAGRLVRTELPDGTLSRVEFSPWFTRSFDPNDTVKDSAWYRERLTTAERGPGARAGSPAEEARALAATPQEKRAATLAAAHHGTPAERHLDSLGRDVLAIAFNRADDGAGGLRNERYATFTRLDAEGKPLWIRDALGHLVMQYVWPPKANDDASNDVGARTPAYDVAGNLLFQHSMDAGDRWMIGDAMGKPMFAWDRNERQDAGAVEGRFFCSEYDALRRPTAKWLAVAGGAARMCERFEHQDAQVPDPANLNAQLVRHYDPSGLVEVVRRDFKGNVLETRRRLNDQPAASSIDWRANPAASLEAETFTAIAEFDALSRITRQYGWHRAAPNDRVAVYEPEYDERGSVVREKLTVRARKTANGFAIDADTTESEPIREIRRDAKGQRESLVLGNGTRTRYGYDDRTLRLRELRTTRPAYDPAFPAYQANLADANVLQQLRYTYDPVGNVTEIYDDAYKPAFFRNAIVEPRGLYEYDALYRLTQAIGREDGAANGAPRQLEPNAPGVVFPVPSPDAQRKYTQSYAYDAVGNIKRMRHDAAPNGSWTREYAYAYEDATQPASNRLWRTWEGDPDWSSVKAVSKVTHVHDTHGNMLNLAPVAPADYLRWDYRDMIAGLHLGGGGDAHYQYDATKQRTRKRIDDQNGLGGYWERIYLPGYELYRRYSAADPATPVEEIDSHHLLDGDQRLLLVDDVIVSSKGTASARPDGLTVAAQTLFRYQYGNHLGSACLELDDGAGIISYEEYHPYGTSAHRLAKAGIEVPPKRYRYTGMERDEESGLAYHSARYMVPSLARWSSAEPVGTQDGVNLYGYCQGNPLNRLDSNGQLATLPLALIGVAVGGLVGVGYALATGKDPVKYGIGGALLGGAAGLTLGMTVAASVAAGGTAEAGVLAWGTKAVIGAGLSSSRQTLEMRAHRRTEISVEDMAFDAVVATSPVPKSIAIPGALTIGTVELAKGTAAARQDDSDMALYHSLMGSASLISGGAGLMSSGGPPGPLVPAGVPAGAPGSMQSTAPVGMAAAPTDVSVPTAVAMSSQVPPTKPASTQGGGGRPSNKMPLKADAGLIHGEDQYRANQVILTAILKLLDGRLLKVAIPNEGAGWRPGQREVAIRLGYRPLGGTTPGSDIHAEASLDAQIQFKVRGATYLSGAKVVRWAISRGVNGTSEVCNGSCQKITQSWGEQEK